jgi:type I restriction enzyme R subunit
MPEFKQIIGRGTRVRDDYGKLWFNIIDYTGSATRLFADPEFDGEPAFISETAIDSTVPEPNVWEVRDEAQSPEEGGSYVVEPPETERRKFYFDGGQVEIAAHLVYELDPSGAQLRVVRYTEYAADRVRTLCPSAPELRAMWMDPERRGALIEQLEERGINFESLADALHQPESDPFDLICHLAFNAPLRTRRERAQQLRESNRDFLARYQPEARKILEELLDKYAEFGEAQFKLPDVLKVPPISEHGQVGDIIKIFGSPEKLRDAVDALQRAIYAA